MSRRHYTVSQTGFSPEPEFLQSSRHRTARYWRKFGKSLARRVFAGVGAVAAAGAANFFTRVPELDTTPFAMTGRGFLAGELPLPKRQKTSVDPSGQYVQLRRSRSKGGKKLGKVDAISRLLHAHAGITIDRFQNVTNINDGAGAYPLTYTAGGVDNRAFPFYIFDLTCLKNVWGTGTDQVDPYPFYRLYRENVNGRYWFLDQEGRTNQNVASYLWQPERQAALITSNAKERAFLEWFDIKMVLYGATSCPSNIEVAIVQFTEEEMTPWLRGNIGASGFQVIEPDTAGVGAAPSNTAQYNRWQTTWQGITDTLVGSTITQRNLAETSRVFKYKFRKTFTFNPTGQESDPAGHQVEFKFKYLMNKVCDYVGNPTEWDEVSTANEGNPNYWPQFDTHKFSATPPNPGREFLMIKAFTPDYNPASPAAKAPSFDLMVRRKRTVIRA